MVIVYTLWYFLCLFQMMERSGVLTDVTAYNSVLEGYSRTGDLGAVFMFYHDMSEAEVPADLHTYHIMIDTVLADASHRSSKVCALAPPQATLHVHWLHPKPLLHVFINHSSQQLQLVTCVHVVIISCYLYLARL